MKNYLTISIVNMNNQRIAQDLNFFSNKMAAKNYASISNENTLIFTKKQYEEFKSENSDIEFPE